MRFIYEREEIFLEDEKRRYSIPKDDLPRLLMRPGTRVLRFEEEGEVISLPLSTAVGEIEGFGLLKKAVEKL